ncbi:MAG: GxGYxYP family putative glycoside hydrolase [bacterium]|nr:GxGYxYP family putative glycoside hydrolase [bacterium]
MNLHYYYPRFPRPKVLLSVREVPTREMAVVLQTLAGLVARLALRGKGHEMIWVPPPQPAYQRWLKMLLEHTRVRLESEHTIWELVERYRVLGVVKGYVIYRMERSSRSVGDITLEMDVSLNVATSLCSALDAVAVEESLEAEAKVRGLPFLADARTMSEEECFQRYRPRFSRKAMAIQDPKIIETRAEMVALDAFVVSKPGALYERVLQHLEPDSPVLGWGTGDESGFTLPSTEWAHFQTATTFCFNLPVFSTERIGRSFPASRLRLAHHPSLWELEWQEDKHYVAFLMTDGDNVSWLMSHFIEGGERSWWSHPHRGRFPMGWTFCYADLAQVCPYALQYLLETATPRDEPVLMGGGYYYPDRFGVKRGNPEVQLQKHVGRISAYMQTGGLRTIGLIMQRWDSPEALRAYRLYAQTIRDLLGILVVQYYPYPAGKGRVVWIEDGRGGRTPVVSARYAIWNNARRENEGTPSMVAQWLNGQPTTKGNSVEECFSWVTVHCWSWFRRRQGCEPPQAEDVDQSQGGQPEVERGLSPVRWCIEQLAPHVQVVTPSQLLLLLHLHKEPANTLHRELRRLQEKCRAKRSHYPRLASQLERQLQFAWRSAERRDYRAAFEAGKAVYQQMMAYST